MTNSLIYNPSVFQFLKIGKEYENNGNLLDISSVSLGQDAIASIIGHHSDPHVFNAKDIVVKIREVLSVQQHTLFTVIRNNHKIT